MDFMFTGLLLGNPKGEHVFLDSTVTQVTQREVVAVENQQYATGTKFVLSLLDIFFDKETLARSLVTLRKDKDQLNTEIINGIMCKAFVVCCASRVHL